MATLPENVWKVGATEPEPGLLLRIDVTHVKLGGVTGLEENEGERLGECGNEIRVIFKSSSLGGLRRVMCARDGRCRWKCVRAP